MQQPDKKVGGKIAKLARVFVQPLVRILAKFAGLRQACGAAGLEPFVEQVGDKPLAQADAVKSVFPVTRRSPLPGATRLTGWRLSRRVHMA